MTVTGSSGERPARRDEVRPAREGSDQLYRGNGRA